MNTIYKYHIKINDSQEIQMPFGAVILHAGLDPQGVPCVWARVDSDNPSRPVRVSVFGTGHLLPDDVYRHLGSFVQDQFMWHVFLG